MADGVRLELVRGIRLHCGDVDLFRGRAGEMTTLIADGWQARVIAGGVSRGEWDEAQAAALRMLEET